MAKLAEAIITSFEGGNSEDKRFGWVSVGNVFMTNKYSITKHFDSLTFPRKLYPYFKTEADENKTFNIVKFLYAPTAASAFKFYGLGVVVGATKAKVYSHDGTLPASTGWSAETNGESARDNRNTEVFFYYKNFIYMWGATRYLIRFDSVGGSAFQDTFFDYGATYSTVASPVHHLTDDSAYFFVDNKVYRLNGTTWDGLVLTLPSNLKIMSACSFGNYMAIACASLQTLDKKSMVYLWDRDSSLATVSAVIDFGEGEIIHLANLNNKLTGIINFYNDNASGLKKGKIIIKQMSGEFAVVLNELLADDTASISMAATRIIRDNKIYFPASVYHRTDTRHGIWSADEFGRVTLEFLEEEAETTSYQGIYLLGQQWWIAHSGDGSVNRSDDGSTFSTTLASVYESLIFNAGDSATIKQLKGVTVMTEKMPADGQVILKFRIDGRNVWRTIFSHTTDNSLSHGAINQEPKITPLTATVSIASPAVVSSTAHGLVRGERFYFTTTGALPTGISAKTVYYVIAAGFTADQFEFAETEDGSAVNTSGSQSGTHTLNFFPDFEEFKEIEFRIESYGGAVITGLKFKCEILDKEFY